MANNRDPNVLKAFGKNLKKRRKAKGLTTRAFADIAEISYGQVWNLENGKVDPTLSTLLAISRVLQVGLDDLVSNEK